METKEHRIREIQPGSIGEELELVPGDLVLAVNGQNLEDVFDYEFLCRDEYVELLIRKESGEEVIYEIEKEEDEDLGILFENGLMDEYRSCRNRCVFCFIDQKMCIRDRNIIRRKALTQFLCTMEATMSPGRGKTRSIRASRRKSISFWSAPSAPRRPIRNRENQSADSCFPPLLITAPTPGISTYISRTFCIRTGNWKKISLG